MDYENPEAYVEWLSDVTSSSPDRWESDIDPDDGNG